MQNVAFITVVACCTKLLTVTVRVLSLNKIFHSMVLTLATAHIVVRFSNFNYAFSLYV